MICVAEAHGRYSSELAAQRRSGNYKVTISQRRAVKKIAKKIWRKM
jgi:hypothetical protein